MTIVILISLLFSIALAISVTAVSRSRRGLQAVCWISVVTTVLGLCISQVVVLQSLATFVLAMVCLASDLNPKLLSRCVVVMGIVSIGFLAADGHSELEKVSQLRKRFPLESISSRLAYEVEPTIGAADWKAPRSAPVLSHNVEQHLQQFEDQPSRSRRTHKLQMLHTKTTTQFIWAQGFGISRMASFPLERIECPEPPIPLDSPSYEPDQPPGQLAANTTAHRSAAPLHDELQWMHFYGQVDFLDRDYLGYIQDRDHVAGFEPHRFRHRPVVPAKNRGSAGWIIVNLELVSLLKHDPPVAYVSKNLPQMDELQSVPTRPLDPFERGAIERLRTAEDLLIEEAEARIRMVGSLRAGKECLQCHSVERGELLGAFSYELVPERPPLVERRDDGLMP